MLKSRFPSGGLTQTLTDASKGRSPSLAGSSPSTTRSPSDRFIAPLVKELAPDLLKLEGVGFASAGELLVTAGENPDRLRSEASFAMLCGACPLPASSGKTQRHRLNRGGNRQANSALHMIVVCRMRTDQRTRDYVARRTEEGLSKREVMRCLKRYVAREIDSVLTAPSPTAPSPT